MKYCTACKNKYDDSVTFCSIDGEVLEVDPVAIVDTVLDGQYQMEALLGKGGMGAVYRARHILLGDRVAIKVLPPEVRTNAEWLRRFRREGQAARRFRRGQAGLGVGVGPVMAALMMLWDDAPGATRRHLRRNLLPSAPLRDRWTQTGPSASWMRWYPVWLWRAARAGGRQVAVRARGIRCC